MGPEEFKDRLSVIKSGIVSNIWPLVEAKYKGNWILDVGSNTGMFIECALEKFPNSFFLAFEPVKKYYEYCLSKFKGNNNIFFENAALSDSDRRDIIFVAEHNIGWNTMVREMVDEDNKRTQELIRSVCFDSYLDYTGLDVVVDIVKIDTEGYEYKVINGMKRFLRDQKPAIICEIGWGQKHPYWKEELEAFEYLYSIGYDRSQEERIKGLTGTTDILFTASAK